MKGPAQPRQLMKDLLRLTEDLHPIPIRLWHQALQKLLGGEGCQPVFNLLVILTLHGSIVKLGLALKVYLKFI